MEATEALHILENVRKLAVMNGAEHDLAREALRVVGLVVIGENDDSEPMAPGAVKRKRTKHTD